ncbi:MAG: hypothetical protein EOP59_11250, partial [Sphingomonadales bacterium]
MSLLLFEGWPRDEVIIAPVVDPYRPDLPDWAQPKDIAPQPGAGGKTRVNFAEAGPVSPGEAIVVWNKDTVALTTDQWSALATFLSAGHAAKNAVAATGISGNVPSDLASLWSGWQAFSTALDAWDTLRSGMIAAANDIIAYANGTAKTLYAQIDALLDGMGLGDPAPAAVFPLLETAISDAAARADAAAAMAGKFAPFVSATNALVAAQSLATRNPPVRVTMPEIGTVCLSHDGNGQAIGGSISNVNDRAQLWTITRARGHDGWVFRNADATKALAVGPLTGVDTSSLPHGTSAESLMPQGPRPTLVASVAGDWDDFETACFTHTGEGYLQPALWPNHTLDCSGNDGWDQGTPVLCWMKNDGSNQKWAFTPRSDAALSFFDAMVPLVIAGGNGIGALEHLEGSWRAIVDDLK